MMNFLLRFIGVHTSIADAREACQADGGSLLDFENAEDSRYFRLIVTYSVLKSFFIQDRVGDH